MRAVSVLGGRLGVASLLAWGFASATDGLWLVGGWGFLGGEVLGWPLGLHWASL